MDFNIQKDLVFEEKICSFVISKSFVIQFLARKSQLLFLWTAVRRFRSIQISFVVRWTRYVRTLWKQLLTNRLMAPKKNAINCQHWHIKMFLLQLYVISRQKRKMSQGVLILFLERVFFTAPPYHRHKSYDEYPIPYHEYVFLLPALAKSWNASLFFLSPELLICFSWFCG